MKPADSVVIDRRSRVSSNLALSALIRPPSTVAPAYRIRLGRQVSAPRAMVFREQDRRGTGARGGRAGAAPDFQAVGSSCGMAQTPARSSSRQCERRASTRRLRRRSSSKSPRRDGRERRRSYGRERWRAARDARRPRSPHKTACLAGSHRTSTPRLVCERPSPQAMFVSWLWLSDLRATSSAHGVGDPLPPSLAVVHPDVRICHRDAIASGRRRMRAPLAARPLRSK